MANTYDYKQLLERVSKKGGGQESARPAGAVASVAFPKGGSRDGFSDYINAIYDASDKARTAQLEAAYNKAASDLAAVRAQTNAGYGEAQRQTAGEAARQQAAFRETANANGLNTGAGGQAALAQSNQMQNDMASLGKAKAQDMANLEMQKELLAQNNQSQRQQLLAQSAYNRNSALYNEAVRFDDAQRQQEQFDRQMNMQMLQMAMTERQKQIAEAKKSTGTGAEDGGIVMDDETKYQTALDILAQNGISVTPLSPASFFKIPSMPYDSYNDYLNKYLAKKVGAGGTE